MAKLSTVSRFIKEDFPSKYSDLTEKLLSPLNAFIETVAQALSNRLTFKDNFACQVVDLEVIAPVNPDNPKSFLRTITGPCGGILITNVLNVTSPTTPLTAAPFVTFENTASQIKVTNITGLTDGSKYRLTMVCLLK